MQNAEDVRELVNRHREDSGPLVAVLRCAAGLLALVAVAASPWLLLSPDGRTAAAPPAAVTASTAPDATTESRRVYEERRQRYEARARRAGTPGQDGLVAGAEPENSSLK